MLRPGGYLLAFGSPRSYHRLTVGLEDAGFEIQNSIMWIYGSGMPKGLNVSKAIDKKMGKKRKVVGSKKGLPGYPTTTGKKTDLYQYGNMGGCGDSARECEITAPATEESADWEGWNTSLKPAFEPIVVARKPLEGGVVDNVLRHGTGAMNVDGCRIPSGREKVLINRFTEGAKPFGNAVGCAYTSTYQTGRWPPNVAFSHLPGCRKSKALIVRKGTIGKIGVHGVSRENAPIYGKRTGYLGVVNFGNEVMNRWNCIEGCPVRELDSGSDHASRFFPVFKLCSKANRKERNAGCESLRWKTTGSKGLSVGNTHISVKPLALMRWLVRLVTPANGIVLDPFLGSGSTAIATMKEGFRAVGIEKSRNSCRIAVARLRYHQKDVTRRRNLFA